MTTDVNRELFDMPQEIAALPRDHRGYPVPAFASWEDGKPDFVRVDPKFFARAVNQRLCWVCGGRLGRKMWFVVGPMCTLTRTSSEPPVHMGCARFSVRNCPFLTRPMAKRKDLTGKEYRDPGGVMIERNPGVTAIWETKSYTIIRDNNNNPLVRMGDPISMVFWKEGRLATKDEALASISEGFPALYEMAHSEGPLAVDDLTEMLADYRINVLDKFYPPPATSQSKKERKDLTTL